MKKFYIILMLALAGMMHAQTATTNKAPADKLRVLILSLNNLSDTNKYPSSDDLKPVIFNSLYNFIGIIPSLDIPEQKVLQKIEWTPEQIAQIAKDRGADLVIYGDYTLSGVAYDPKAKLNLKIYSTERVVDLLSKTYNTPTDIEIFDTIDRVINDLSVELLKGKVEVAYLNFHDFEVGDEAYDIYVNDKIIASITNSDFQLNLKILANTSYGVEIIRRFDKKAVHDSSFVLQPGVTANISHRAQATLDLKALTGKKKGSAYTLKLNDTPILDNQKYTNILGGQKYNLVVIEDGTNLAYSNSFYLHDSGKITVKPFVKSKGGAWGLSLSFNDESMIQAAVTWNFHPKFWVGAGAGFSYLPISLLVPVSDPSNQIQSPLFVNTYIGAGYSFLGDKDSNFRLGVDISLHYTLISMTPNIYPGININPLTLGAFISAEWKFLFLKVGTYYDISNNRFYFLNMGYPNIVGGFKFRFGNSGRSEKPEGLGIQIGINDESMIQVALLKTFGTRFWIAGGVGASLWPQSMLESSLNVNTLESGIFFLLPYIGLGYHILGDTEKDFRLGAELSAHYVLISQIPSQVMTQLGNVNPRPFSVGLFARAEWKFLYLKAGYYFDISNFKFSTWYPTISGGVVLRFK